MIPPKLSFPDPKLVLGGQKKDLGPRKVINTSILHPKNIKNRFFQKNWTYMIWLSTVWDSHSTRLQGPTGRFDGQFIKSKLCFQLVCMSNLPKFAQIGTYKMKSDVK